MTTLYDMQLEANWLSHISDGFPRLMLFIPKDKSTKPVEQIPEVSSKSNYLSLIKSHIGEFHCHTSVYPIVGLFNKVYIDLDAEKDLTLAYKEMRTIVEYYKSNYNYNVRTYFTGQKGFALYVDFPYIKLTHMCETMKEYVRILNQQLNLTTTDPLVLGQPNRLSRIPYTMHVTSGRRCIPIDPAWSLDEILTHSQEDKIILNVSDLINPIRSEKFIKEIYALDKLMRSTPKRLNSVVLSDDKVLDHLKIVNMILRSAKNVTDHRHRILFGLLVPHLVWAGFDLDSTRSKCEEWLNNTPEDGKKSMSNYMRYIDATFKRTLQGKWNAWSLRKFTMQFPETGTYWIKENVY